MEFLECVKTRRSIRNFKEEKLPKEMIEDCVAVASLSPSWKNSQIVRYYYTDNEEIMNIIGENHVLNFTFNTNTIKNAAGIMILSMIPNRSGYEKDGSFSTPKEDRFEMFDAGIASQTFCLAATEKGIGTVVLGYFEEDSIKKLLDIPAEHKIACVIAMGYPDEKPEPSKRKSVEELLVIR